MPPPASTLLLLALFLLLDAAILHRVSPPKETLLAHLPPALLPSLYARADALRAAIWTPAVAGVYHAARARVYHSYMPASVLASRWSESASLHGFALYSLARRHPSTTAAQQRAQQLINWTTQRIPPSLVQQGQTAFLKASDAARTHASRYWPAYVLAAQVLLVLGFLLSCSRSGSASAAKHAPTTTPEASGDVSAEIPSRYQLHQHSSSPDTTLAEDEGAPAPAGAEPVASTPTKANAIGNGAANAAVANGASVPATEKKEADRLQSATQEANGVRRKPLPAEPQEQEKSASKLKPGRESAVPSSLGTPSKLSHPPSSYKGRSPRDEGDSQSILKRSGSKMRQLRQSFRRSSGEKLFGRSRASLSVPEQSGDASFESGDTSIGASPLRKGRGKRLSTLILGEKKN